MSTKIRSLATATVVALALALTAPASAQMSSQVQFQHGKDHAVLNGTITGHEYYDYVLRARAGQTMAVKLTVDGTNGDGSAYFNILPPGSDNVAIFKRLDERRRQRQCEAAQERRVPHPGLPDGQRQGRGQDRRLQR